MSEFIKIIFTRKELLHFVLFIGILFGAFFDIRIFEASLIILLTEVFFIYLICFFTGKFLVRTTRFMSYYGVLMPESKRLKVRIHSLIGTIFFGAVVMFAINGFFFSNNLFYSSQYREIAATTLIGLLCAIYYYRYSFLAERSSSNFS